MPWFPQMWAAGVLLNGRLLRENALQGAEQLGGETVRALNGGFVPSRDWQALAPGVCVWGRGRGRGQGESSPRKLHCLSRPLLCRPTSRVASWFRTPALGTDTRATFVLLKISVPQFPHL